MHELVRLNGIGPALAEALTQNGFASLEDVASATTEALMAVPGIGQARAQLLITAAKEIAPPQEPTKTSETAPKKAVPEKTSKKKKKKSKSKDKGKGKDKSPPKSKTKKADAKKSKNKGKTKKDKKPKKADKKPGKTKPKSKKPGKSKKK